MDQPRSVFFLSDHTGITVDTLGKALLAQFPGNQFRRIAVPYIDSKTRASEAARRIEAAAAADELRPIAFGTLPDPSLRQIIRATPALYLDFLEQFIGPLETEFGSGASHAEGKAHDSHTPQYARRIDAINFTLAHDDGVIDNSLDDAEIILVGVSRAGKTPTCLYLSMQFGLNAANFPLTEEDLEAQRLPASLQNHRAKLFGLSIDPARIQQIRQERRPDSRYASLTQCRYEVRQAEKLMRANGIPFLDSTHMSIEEIATKIIQQRDLKRHAF